MAKSTKSISKEVKNKVLEIVDAFNEEHKTAFQMTFRGRFAYLSKTEKQKIDTSRNNFIQQLMVKMGMPIQQGAKQNVPTIETKLGRLKYEGQMDNWSFAVFKYSRETYDANEFLFPGASELDGTIEGALRAGLELYP